MSDEAPVESAVEAVTDDIQCVSRDPREPCGPKYREACTGRADLVATSLYCPPGECGGHPICRPCYELAIQEGLVR